MLVGNLRARLLAMYMLFAHCNDLGEYEMRINLKGENDNKGVGELMLLNTLSEQSGSTALVEPANSIFQKLPCRRTTPTNHEIFTLNHTRCYD